MIFRKIRIIPAARLKGKTLRHVFTVVIILLSAPFTGCHYLRVHRSAGTSGEEVGRYQGEGKFIIVHLGDDAWHLTDISVGPDTIKGTLTPFAGRDLHINAGPDKPVRYRTSPAHDETEALNEVHLFTTEMITFHSGQASIPVNAITSADVFDKATGTTIAAWTFGAMGALAGAAAVVTGITLLVKESCPFVYVHNGAGYSFTGEIFSGALQPGLERDDYLKLPSITPVEGSYKIKLTNEVREIQSVNIAELLVFDHRQGTEVQMDKHGKAYLVTDPVMPVSARSNSGSDILPLLSERDSLSYLFNDTVAGRGNAEEIVLEFVRPHDAVKACLIIRARNSFWLDGLLLRIHSLFGRRYKIYSSRQEKASGDTLRQWSIAQKFPLAVSIYKEGQWIPCDYFNIAGPMAMRDDILPLDVQGIESDTIRLKLETGFLFWEIDNVRLDFNSETPGTPIRITAADAVSNNADVRGTITKSDESYFVLDSLNDELTMSFQAPPLNGGTRTIILHSGGYYKLVRDFRGRPDKNLLRTFMEPGRIPEYSRQVYDSITTRIISR